MADPAPRPAWLAALEPHAPDVVALFAALAEGRPLEVRRGVRGRAGQGSAARILPQHKAIAEAYAAYLDALPDAAFGLPGGEADWTVAQALGHAFDARAGLVTAASLAAQGRVPADAPTVVPGVPGPGDASRDELIRRLAASQRIVERAARAVGGRETDPCPLKHPHVGRLRCGEWFLFAGLHDLMHLEQLDALAASFAAPARAAPARSSGARASATLTKREVAAPAPARSFAALTKPEAGRP